MIHFELEEATDNPLFQERDIEPLTISRDIQSGEAVRPRANIRARKAILNDLVSIPTVLVDLLPLALSILYLLAGILSVSIAREYNDQFEGESFEEFIDILSVATVSELMIFPALFAMGIFVCVAFNSFPESLREKRRKQRVLYVIIAIVIATWSMLIALGPMPAVYIERTQSSVANRGNCKLFAQGFQASESASMNARLASVCPTVAHTNRFYALQPKLADIHKEGYSDNKLMKELTFMKDMIQIGVNALGVTLNGTEMSLVVDMMCSAFIFKPCNKPDCRLLEPCIVFDPSWYDIPYATRQMFGRSFQTNGFFTEQMDKFVPLIGDGELQQYATAMAELIQTHDHLVVDHWDFPQNKSYCSFDRQNVSTLARNNCDPALQDVALGETEIILNPQYGDLKRARIALLSVSLMSMLALIFALPGAKLVVYRSTYSINPKRSLCLTVVLQSAILCMLLLLATLTMYGGAFIAISPGYRLHDIGSSLKCLVPLFYFAVAMCTCCSFGAFFSKHPGNSNTVDAPTDSWYSSWKKAITIHPMVQYLRDCNNPECPEYMYRIMFMEGLECLLQISAMLSAQRLNAEYVLLAMIAVAVNVCGMFAILHYVPPSPRRVYMMLSIELVFDMYFAAYGIMRLRSNLGLSVLEHLALIKPVISINLDVYDLHLVSQLADYENEKKWKSLKIKNIVLRSHSQRTATNTESMVRRKRAIMIGVGFLPVALAVIVVVKYVSTQAKCSAVVGKVLRCASQRYFFDVPFGILGAPSCSFASIKTLACSNMGIEMLPPRIGSLMPHLEQVDLSHNPSLEKIPASMARMRSLHTLNISYTGVKSFPFEMANATHLKQLSIAHTPVEAVVDWSGSGIEELPSPKSVFYKVFRPTLQRLQLSGNRFRNVAPFARLLVFEQLKYINLSGNALDDVQGFGFNLAHGIPSIVELDLSRNNFRQFEISPKRSPHLRINLRGNPLSRVDFLTLVDGAATKTYLHERILFPMNTIKETRFRGCNHNIDGMVPLPPAFDGVISVYAYEFSVLRGSLKLWQTMHSLKTLNLQLSKLTGTFEPLSKLTKLTSLDLTDNRISGSFKWLHKLVALESLRVELNSLSGTLDPLSELTKMRYLNTARNKLTGSLHGLRRMQRLKYLDISSNALNGTLVPLSATTSLHTLHASDNDLKGTLNVFRKHSSLQEIVLSNNKLVGTLDGLKQLKVLRHLDVRFNYLNGTLEPLTSLSFLSSLMLTRNNFTGTLDWLKHSAGLITLYADINHLSGTMDPLGGFKSLEYVNLGFNDLTGTLDGLIIHTSIKRLYLSSNRFNGTLRGLSNMVRLKVLNVAKNQLIGPLYEIRPLKLLQVLNLRDNKLVGNLEGLETMSMLSYFDAANNRLTGTLDGLKLLTSMSILDLSGNHLSGTLDGLLQMTSLTLLSLNETNLTGTADIFARFKQLQSCQGCCAVDDGGVLRCFTVREETKPFLVNVVGGCKANLCGRCQGDCDSDDQCLDGLKCFQRVNWEDVPGCQGSLLKRGEDYCYKPT